MYFYVCLFVPHPPSLPLSVLYKPDGPGVCHLSALLWMIAVHSMYIKEKCELQTTAE